MYFLENKVKTDSIILTVFNKDWLIDKVLYSIFENTKTNIKNKNLGDVFSKF